MKCLIFGGAGFIGSTIADRLLRDRHELRIFERPRILPYRKFTDSEQVEWVTGDLSNAHEVGDAVHGMDVVLHLVSSTLPNSSNEDPIYDVQSNLVATLHMLNTMVVHKVRKIVFISSGGTVYGNSAYLPIDEKHPTNPLVSYGVVKLTIEKYLQIYSHLYGIQAISLRVSNPYGERQRIETAQGAVRVFLNRALKGLPIEIWGDGSVIRDYIHVSDVAEAFVKALGYQGVHNCFNISSGTGISLNELITILVNVLEKKIDVIHKSARPFDVPVNILSNDLAKKELNWIPKVQIHEGILLTSEWVRSELIKQQS